MKLAVVIGIDPGKKGAIAYRTSGNYADVIDMPEDDLEGVKEYLLKAIDGANLGRVLCCIEKQQNWGRSDVLMGRKLTDYLMHYGRLVTILGLLGIKYREIPAKKWQSDLLGPVPKGETKEAAIKYASQQVPYLKDVLKPKTKGRADAMCLALYAEQLGKMMEEGW